MDFSADGNRIAAMIDTSTLAIWSARSEARQALIRNLREPKAVALSDDGRTLAIAESARISIWDARRGREQAALNGYQPFEQGPVIALSPDGHTIATVGARGRIDVWHTMTGRHLRTLQDVSADAVELAFSPDGAQLMLAMKGGTKVWRGMAAAEARAKLRLLAPAVGALGR